LNSENPSSLAGAWSLDPAIDFLNHGSFGACPNRVLEVQAEWRARMEREPVRFLVHELEGLLDEARMPLAALVGADPQDLAFVPNATWAVNALLGSAPIGAGDELLTTDHEYNACRNVLEHVAQRAGARVVTARIPFPLQSADQAVEAVLSAMGPRTRLALLDHVTSQTGLVLPLERIVPALAERGVICLVDGAHGVGQLALDLDGLGATAYTSNCHKWLCAPKGAAFVWVRRDAQKWVRPACISHGANSPRRDRSRFRLEFDWTGTDDPTAYLCVPDCIRFLEGLLPGGLCALRHHNRELVLYGRDRICESLGISAPAPDDMIGHMAGLPLPDGVAEAQQTALYADPLQDALYERGIQVPVVPWPAPPRRLIRISAQAYNHPAQYDRLVSALTELL
jgi:isopenicillin-N epimerase